MTEIRDMSKLIEAAKKMGITEEELRAFLPLMLEVQDEKNKSKGKAKGGDIGQQMEMFQDGGLKDEGGTKDPVSGNDVPPGATQEEVRDDIPAQLSEGEFVFPADVVRYIGLEKLMTMRQEAKMGLKMMEKMGQMGNSEEASMPDDMPFSIIDIEIAEDDDEEEDKDKTIKANTGTYVPPAIAEPAQAFRYTPTSNQPKEEGRATFASLMGDVGGPDEYRTFINDQGVEIQVPYKNDELFTGFTVPEGFYPKTEEVKSERVTSAKVDTAKVDPEVSDGGDDGDDFATLGGARVDVGGREFAVAYNFDGSITLTDPKTKESREYAKNNPITQDVKAITTGNIVDLGNILPKGIVATAVNRGLQKIGVNIPGNAKIDDIRNKAKEAKNRLDKTFSLVGTDPSSIVGKDMKGIQDALEKGKGVDVSKMQQLADLSDPVSEDRDERMSQMEDAFTATTPAGVAESDQPDFTSTDSSNSGTYSEPGTVGASEGSFGGIGDFKQGGLAKKKKKTKVKKKKRSGLASKK